MKSFLAPKVRKSILKKLDFELFFNFLVFDKFLLFPLALLLPPLLVQPSAFCFSIWVFWGLLPIDISVVQSIKVSIIAIRLKFQMNFFSKFAKPKIIWRFLTDLALAKFLLFWFFLSSIQIFYIKIIYLKNKILS